MTGQTTLFAQLRASARMDDLDGALAPLQGIIGQSDGGFASQFFSGPNGDDWPTMPRHDRLQLLLDYVEQELRFELMDDESDDPCPIHRCPKEHCARNYDCEGV